MQTKFRVKTKIVYNNMHGSNSQLNMHNQTRIVDKPWQHRERAYMKFHFLPLRFFAIFLGFTVFLSESLQPVSKKFRSLSLAVSHLTLVSLFLFCCCFLFDFNCIASFPLLIAHHPFYVHFPFLRCCSTRFSISECFGSNRALN